MDEGKERSVQILFSCTPGLEKLCESELKEKLHTDAWKESRGRILAFCPFPLLGKLCDLRSVYHYYAVAFNEDLDYMEGEEKDFILEKLEILATNDVWRSAIVAWKTIRDLSQSNLDRLNVFHAEECPTNIKMKNIQLEDFDQSTGSPHPDYNNIDSLLSASASEKICSAWPPDESCEGQTDKLRFRVTTNRVGKHCITSPEASRVLGSGVKERFGWEVDLENYDINVQAFINGPKLILSLQLTSSSLHKRNLSHFGPTSLTPTICYCILKLADPQDGDVICDPMCGGGSISLEGVHSFPQAFHLGGEIHPEGCQRSRANFESYSAKEKGSSDCITSVPCDVVQWDACNLPLRTGSADIVVCDLPFGRKMGHRTKNWSLYTCALREGARVCRTSHGRAVLLTQHKEAFNRALKLCAHLWRKKSMHHVSMGGLNVGVYVLTRTSNMPKTDLQQINVEKKHSTMPLQK